MLTEQQISHYQTFGFLVFRQMLTPAEVDTLSNEFRTEMETAYRHMPFDGTKRHWLTMFAPSTPFFAGLLEDPRFYTPAEQLYGDDAIGCCIDANRYIGNTGWHPDTTPEQSLPVIKFVFYLQPVGAESGGLRVIPGSHHPPFADELRQRLAKSAPEIGDVPAYVFDSKPGDVLAFDVRLWHASLGGSTDRWMCTMLYARNPKTREAEKVIGDFVRNQVTLPAAFHCPDHLYYTPEWLANPHRNPRRQRWIDRIQELGFFDPSARESV